MPISSRRCSGVFNMGSSARIRGSGQAHRSAPGMWQTPWLDPALTVTMPFSNNYTGLAGYSHEPAVQPVQAGVLLVNLGTPAAPTAKAVRPYLANSSPIPRVIEYPRWLWWLILHGVILRLRPKRSAHAYGKVWTEQGSPLRFGSEALASGPAGRADPAAARRHRSGWRWRCATASHRSRDTIASCSAKACAGCWCCRCIRSIRPPRPARCSMPWPTRMKTPALAAGAAHRQRLPRRPGHIEALALSIERWWATHGRGEKLLLSFHGIPERYLHAGDPYFCQCHATARLLRERLRTEPTINW